MSERRKGTSRRMIAILLTLALIAPLFSGLEVQAEKADYPEVIPYDPEEMKETLFGEENTGTSTISFPHDAFVAEVGTEVVYHLFRGGDTSKEQTVTLMTTDITAGYREDYEIAVDDKVVDGEAKPMFDGSDTIYDVYIGEDVLKESNSESENGSGAESEEELSKEELIAQMRKQASSVFDVTFAPEEEEKEIRIRIYMPERALGNREMQLSILECPEGMDVGENPITAVTLKDPRETEPSTVSIVKDSSEQVDGYVTVLVERTGNTEGYTTYSLQSEDGTAVNGEDYILDQTQLTFTPGVAVQRIHIPLVAGDAGIEKEFTVKTDHSEETIKYSSVARGATFKSNRTLVDLSFGDFSIGEISSTGDTGAGEVDFYKDDDEDRYIFSFDTGFGDGDNRSASIRSDTKYDFTGIDKIRISASYRPGTIVGDYLNVYASNTDFCDTKSSLASVATNKYGGRIATTSLTGQGVHDLPVDRIGEYYVYLTAEQHNGPGYIGYNLYDEEFDDHDDDKGHLALVKKKYSLELVSPTQLNANGTSKSPVSTQKLTLSSDENVYGSNLNEVYRDDTFVYSCDLNIPEAKLIGYDIVDKDGGLLYRIATSSTMVNITTTVLHYVETQEYADGVIRIRPRFQLPSTKVTVKPQNFEEIGAEGLTAKLDEKQGALYYYDNGVRIATFIWSSIDYYKGDTLTVKVEENGSYNGDFHFDSYKILSGFTSDLSGVNPVYYTDKEWKITLNDDYYEVMPLLSNSRAPLYLDVKNADHGDFIGKPKDFKGSDYTVTDYDGKYETSDIVMFSAKPDEGYRAKWTCYDIVTNTNKTYYGSVFYYMVQSPIRSTDNIVTLEFETCTSKTEYTMSADVYMQGGSVLHQPDARDANYAPLEGASVSVEGKETLITDENGVTTKTVTFKGSADETHTALVMANNRKYIHEYKTPKSGANIREMIKLSYYYNGPRVTSLRYFDNTYEMQSGDTIYLEDEADICEIAATVETSNKKVNCVEFSIVSPDGEVRMEAEKAEIKGSEYTWAKALGMCAQEGDQIFIELLYQYVDKDGKLHRESYGKVNTGYNIVIADYETVSYIPDTGGVSSSIPWIGNISFNFSIKGLKPIFTTSRSGNYMFITLGGSFGFMPLPKAKREETGKKIAIPSWSNFMDQLKGMNKLRSKDEKTVMEGKQALKKNTIAFGVPVSFQLAFYMGEDKETKKSEMYFLGAFFSVGFNASYTFSIPFVAGGIPMFATVVVTGSVADTIQIYSQSNTGIIAVDAIKDPSKSCYKPDNDFKASFDLSLTAGVGASGIAGVSGGAKAGLVFDWIDFSYGKGVATVAGIFRVDLLVLGRTFTLASTQYEMFDTNPYVKSAGTGSLPEDLSIKEAVEGNKLDQWKFKRLNQYAQSVSGTGSALVSGAYEFSRPAICPMGGEKYLIVCTVDSKFVNGCTEAGNAVLSYVVYDSSQKKYLNPADGSYISDISVEKVFTSLEPASEIGNSLNFNPKLVKAGDRYVVTWNSVLYGAQKDENLDLSNIRTVIKSAIIGNPEDFTTAPVYKSLVLTSGQGGLTTNTIIDVEYDQANDEVLMMYRMSDLSGITAESTLKDYTNCDTALCVTSLKVADSVSSSNSTWKNSVVITSAGEDNVLKSADMDMMKDGGKEVPVIAWNRAVGENASIFSEGEDGTTNDIMLARLSYIGGKYSKENEVTVPSEGSYQSSPVLAVNGSRNVLMWKEGGRMAVGDPVELLNGLWDSPIDREENANALTLDGLENITNISAGNNDDFRLIEGMDGNLYAMWTEPNADGDGHAVKVACLDAASGWGEGSTVVELEDGNYIQYMSAVVDANSKLQMLYRQMNLKDNTSRICMESKDLEGRLVVSDISVEQNGVKAGETITVTADIKNAGVKALPDKQLRLYENGRSTAAIESVRTLASGKTARVQFQYKVPASINSSDIDLSAVPDGMGRSVQSTGTGVSASLYASSDLKFEMIRFIPLHISNETEPDKYKVLLQIANEGDADSYETEAVASYLEYQDDENGESTVIDHVLGHVTIPAVAAGDSEQASFYIEVPQEYYVNPDCKYAEVDFALYDSYNTEDQGMVALTYDGVKALTEERAEEIKAEMAQHIDINVNQTKALSVKFEPATAKIYSKLTYKSSDPQIASVDENGMVTGHKKGTCTITITTENGLSTKAEIYVAMKESGGGSDQEDGSTSVKDDKGNVKKDSNTKTGDENPVILLLVILMVCGAVMIGVVMDRKRKGGAGKNERYKE